MISNIAIVVICYNRVNALLGLLESLKKVHAVSESVDLLISVEYGAPDEVIKIAYAFTWGQGEKKVILHSQKLGLRKHFIWVGDQTEKYENIIFLEDDLFVSPFLLRNVFQIIHFYKNDNRIAGISLYSPLICEFNGCRFYPLEDGYDTFFSNTHIGGIFGKEINGANLNDG